MSGCRLRRGFGVLALLQHPYAAARVGEFALVLSWLVLPLGDSNNGPRQTPFTIFEALWLGTRLSSFGAGAAGCREQLPQ